MTELAADVVHPNSIDPRSSIPSMSTTLERVRRTRRDGKLIVGLTIVGVFVLLAALAPVLTAHDPERQDVLDRLASPSREHWLGTDGNGRDVFARLLYAARVDLPLSLVLALIPAAIGSVVGAFAGYFGRIVDAVVMRTADLVQAFPTYIFILALVAALEPGPRSIIIAFSCLAWVTYARLIRSEVLRLRHLDFVAAARAGGLSHVRILFRHVLPNGINSVVVFLPADILLAIVALSSLSFLGVGIQEPTPEWGSMIADGQPFATTQWWLVTVPGIAIVVLGAGLMLVADALDDRLRRR